VYVAPAGHPAVALAYSIRIGLDMRHPIARTCVSLVLILGAQLAAGCGGDSDSDSPTSPSQQPRGEFSQTDLRAGTGAEATVGRQLAVNYSGWLYDPGRPENKGTQFDSNTGRGPFGFQLGAGRVIRGWDQGLVGMRVGGQRRLVIPPELGYGAGGSPPAIPANATLVFDVELLDVQ
jgi:FKBP-type peptidyl-prolyl cis-trans isomerase